MDVLAGLPGGYEITILLIFLVIIPLIALLPTIFYLLTLQKALNRCAVRNRAMAGGMVWLYVIPVFSMIWHFFIVINVAKSLDAEFKDRGIRVEPQPGKTLGLWMCILAVCSILPFLGLFAAFASFICWIIYWIKIAGFSARLA